MKARMRQLALAGALGSTSLVGGCTVYDYDDGYGYDGGYYYGGYPPPAVGLNLHFGDGGEGGHGRKWRGPQRGHGHGRGHGWGPPHRRW